MQVLLSSYWNSWKHLKYYKIFFLKFKFNFVTWFIKHRLINMWAELSAIWPKLVSVIKNKTQNLNPDY